MNIRILTTSMLALALLAPAAIASNSFGNPNAPTRFEETSRRVDYLVDDVTTASTKAFAVKPGVTKTVKFNTGDYIDESNVERHQRSNN